MPGAAARTTLVPCLVLAAALAAAFPARGDALTIERIFAEPPLGGTLPTELRWAPDGTRFAMVECTGTGADEVARLLLVDAGAGGATTTLVADEKALPAFAARGGSPAATAGATAGASDATVRPRVKDYAWAPGGDALLLQGDGELFLLPLVRPGGPAAGPAAGRGDAGRDAAAIVQAGPVRRLTATASAEEGAQFSPDGRWLAYVRDHDLYALELASGRELRLSTDGGEDRINGAFDWLYQEELAGPATEAFAWSPDGRAIVYLTFDETGVPRFPLTDWLQTRPAVTQQVYPRPGDPNPKPGLRVVPVRPGDGVPAAREILWPTDEVYVPRVGWTPDGRSVWYQLLDRAQRRLDLVRVDLASGASALLVSDSDPLWVNLDEDAPYFLKDGRFLASSERDGFRHLYLHEPSGKVLRALTAGPWEVTRGVAVDEAAGQVYFQGTRDGARERQLYRVGLDGGAITRITREPGTHDVDLGPGARLAIDKHSRADAPAALWLVDAQGGARVRAIAANEAPPLAAFPRATTTFVDVAGPGGVTLHASLLKPADFDPARRYPVLVYVYGGPHAQVARDAWGGRYALFHRYLASRGILVFSLDNRGSAARGRDFERALGGRLGKVELEDQLAGVAWLKAQPYVDGARIGIWGWSYGGYLTLYALANAPDAFAFGAAVAPVTDWRLYDSAYTERYLKRPAENADGYRDSSPVNQADRIRARLLLAHGTTDDNVHWQNTLLMTDRLYRAGIPYALQLYPNKDHGIGGTEARTHLHRELARAIEQALLAPAPPPTVR